MNESIRTLIFVGVAGLIGLVAYATKPRPQAPAAASAGDIVQAFDVSEANSFKIERYNPDDQKLSTFEVAKEGGRWVIPSHGNYPADAQSQLQKVASFFTGMKAIGGEQSHDLKQHAKFGVLQPTADTTGDGKGYGTVVTIADSTGKDLVHLVVGLSAAPNDSEGKSAAKSYRYVRKVGQDAVYVVEVSLDAITTRFSDWIEQDLLKLNSFDIAKLSLHDYSLIRVQDVNGIGLSQDVRMDTTVKWNSESNNWDLEKMLIFAGNEKSDEGLAPDEELNKTKLDGVKTAVDDLKIVDVERKPPELFQALKDEKLARDPLARRALAEFGFFALTEPGGKRIKVFATNGALSVSMKDGVRYQLYFGDPKSAEKEDSKKLNRYLMVMAELDESMLVRPMLAAEDEPLGPDPTDKPDDAKPDEDKSPDKDDTSEKQDEEAATGKRARSGGDEKSDEEKSDEEKNDDAAKKRREAVKKENKRKLDEYNDKVKKAQTRVNELNARFNDWFYVVSDDVYKKVQLGRADIVKDRETAKDEGFGVDAFRRLEQGGIEGKAPPPASPPPGLPSGFGGFPPGQ
jgi:hypothetical protein